MKKALMGAAFLLLFFLLQCTAFKYFAVNNIGPNLLIILTCTYGFMYSDKEGLLMGFFAGILCDIFFGPILGINALIFMFIGFTAGKFNRLFYAEDIVLPGSIFVAGDITYGLIYYILLFLLRRRFQFTYYLMDVILPETIYTLVGAIAFYPLLLLCINKLNKIGQRRRKGFA